LIKVYFEVQVIFVSNYLGRVAGWNAAKCLLSESFKPFDTVPFFWTMQYGKSIRVVGSLAEGFEKFHLRGNPDELKFEIYYQSTSMLAKEPVQFL